MNAGGVSPETDDSNNIINNGDKNQADGLPPIMGICTNQDLGKTEVEEENNFEAMGEINDGHKEISTFINIDNECKSDETRKKKKKKRKKSKSNKVHATYDEPEETPFNVEVCRIPPASNEDDEHAQSHKTEITKEKSVGVETDSLYGESVVDTQEKKKKRKNKLKRIETIHI